jgi:hypothetical protein
LKFKIRFSVSGIYIVIYLFPIPSSVWFFFFLSAVLFSCPPELHFHAWDLQLLEFVISFMFIFFIFRIMQYFFIFLFVV